MTAAGPQLLGSLSLASHRDGSPIVLPRAKDETVMLAFDQQNGRLVELHVVTGKTASAPHSNEAASRRWIRPESLQVRQKASTLSRRAQSRCCKPTGRRRLVQDSRTHARYLHRFYQPKSFAASAVAVPPAILDAEMLLETCELLRGASRMQGSSFMSVLESGMDDGMPYYITHLNDGEFVQDYIRRCGALPTVTALALVKQLLRDLVAVEEHSPLLSTMRLERVLVSSQEEEFLQLRVFDYGLSRQGAATPYGSPLVRDLCCLLFLLMTGQPYAGGNPDSFGVIAELPSALRFLMRQVLTKPSESAIKLKTLRAEVREALCSLVSLAQARNPRSLLAAAAASLPISHLQHLLLGNIPLKTLFGASFRIEHPELAGCHPFAVPAVNVCGSQDVTLHLLPPQRIVTQPDFAAPPSQSWRQDPARQPNLLHMLHHWQGPDWAFLSEAREPGMNLGSLMAKRGTLNPVEVTLLLRQIHAGLEQALETGAQQVDLEPANIQLCVGYDGPVLPRDLERLHQKRLDVWPRFMVKLRLHKTMRSLCQPRVIDPGLGAACLAQDPDVLGAREERQRSLICLAAYLLSGEGQMRSISEFPVSVPPSAASYLHECLQAVFIGTQLPTTADFTEKLCQHLTIIYSDSEDEEGVHPVAAGEMESAGFVSDFEEDWPAESPVVQPVAEAPRHTPVVPHIRPFELNLPPPRPTFHFPWLALSATILLLGALAWMILGDLPGTTSQKITAVPSSQAAKPASLKEPAAAALPAKKQEQPLPQPPPVIHQSPSEKTVVEAVPQTIPSLLAAATTQEHAETAKAAASAPALKDSTLAVAEIEPVILPGTAPEATPEKPATVLPIPSTPSVSTLEPKTAASAAIDPPTTSTSVPAPAVETPSEPIVIRHAIILSPEEIRQAMQQQASPKKRRTTRR